jgi:hypothetical protein
MHLYKKPSTNLGIYSVWLIIAAFIFFIVFYSFIISGQRGGDSFFSNLSLAIPMLTAAILAILSFLTGIISIISKRERASLVYISTILGFFVLLFGLVEIIFPH